MKTNSLTRIVAVLAIFSALTVTFNACNSVQGVAFQPKIVFKYTGVGDDDKAGCASVRELRVSPDSVLIANNPGAAPLVPIANPTPACGGQPDSMVVTNFTALTKTKYFARIRSGDDENPINWSGYSNIAVKIWADTIPPATVTDFQ